MSLATSPTVTLQDLFRILRTYWLRWLVPAAIVSLLTMFYAARKPAIWEASQALIVRDEATGGDRPGKFHLAEDMKTVQETLMELVKSRSVLSAALMTVGPPAGRKTEAAWPTDLEIAGQQEATKLSPPHGAEFGKTEVFYLQVQSTDRQRAEALAAAVSEQLKQRFEDLRDAKARSLVDELNKSVALAHSDLDKTTSRQAEMDGKAGQDLGELRTLMDAPSGDSPLRRSITEMESELRGSRAAAEANRELLKLLQASRTDQRTLLAAPSRLLESQPELRRLKDGLVDAQLHTSLLLGSMSESHPAVLAAKAAEAEITRHLGEELDGAVRGVRLELNLALARTASLNVQLAEARNRLDRLAGIRAEYANVSAEVHRRADTLKTCETQLAEAQASQAAAHTASLVSRIDTPDTGVNPIGLSRGMIALFGTLGGLLVGCGVLFLTIPPVVQSPVSTTDANGRGNSHEFDLATREPAEHALSATLSSSCSRKEGASKSLNFKQALAKIQGGGRGR